MKKETKYCTYRPNFPKKAFVVIVHLTHKSLSRDYVRSYPLINLVPSLDEIVRDISDFSKYANKKGELIVENICTVVPVTFHSLFPLRKEFWMSPTQHYEPQDRIKLFMKALSNYEMYKLLATPYEEDFIETVAATIPFYLSADDSLIEKFMLTSDWPVDNKAKYAAFYLFDKPQSFNWKTKEVSGLLNNKDIKYNN